MDIKNYINKDFKYLSIDQPVSEVKKFFQILPFTHFPVVDNGLLAGMIAQYDISNLSDNEATLAQYKHLFKFYKSDQPESCIELIHLFALYNTDILPVTDKDNMYLGYFELDEILRLFYKTPFISQSSITLLIETNLNNYSMGEIAQIVESNNVKLLGLYISKVKEDRIQITLRIEGEDINEVIQSLRRYEYTIITQNEEDILIDEIKDRAAYLEKYLNI